MAQGKEEDGKVHLYIVCGLLAAFGIWGLSRQAMLLMQAGGIDFRLGVDIVLLASAWGLLRGNAIARGTAVAIGMIGVSFEVAVLAQADMNDLGDAGQAFVLLITFAYIVLKLSASKLVSEEIAKRRKLHAR